MHLYAFCTELEQAVVDFQAYWRSKHNDPETKEQFPYEMEEAEWEEHFLTWLELRNG